jgi:hypothetical protein
MTTKTKIITTVGGGRLTITEKENNDNEKQNSDAFAVIKLDGSVVTWGRSDYGGDSSSIASSLNGSIDVQQIFSTGRAFAALRTDGSVVTWGSKNEGGNSSSVAAQLDGRVDVLQIYSNYGVFAALRIDGSVVTWGDSDRGGDSSEVAGQLDGRVDVQQIYSTTVAFAALRIDGSVITWGDWEGGGDSSEVAGQLDGRVDVKQIYSTTGAFAALRTDGSVFTWGESNNGGDSNAVSNSLNGSVDVQEISSNAYAFAALRMDGSVVTWGDPISGGDASALKSSLNVSKDFQQIYSSWYAFAALRKDGSVVTWGHPQYGGDSRAVASSLNGSVDVQQIFATGTAFAALRTDGSVVTWGSSSYGGDSSSVASSINGSIDVQQIYSNGGAFAALRVDGSVVTWGRSDYGGDSSSIASSLNGSIDVQQIFSTDKAFAALRTDGSIVTWGSVYDSNDNLVPINTNIVAKQIKSSVVSFANAATDDIYIAPPAQALPTGNVTISGTVQQNQTLTVTNTLVDINGLGLISYQWLSNSDMISNATQSNYTLTQTDVGKKITVKASYTDNAGTAESVTSVATSIVTNINDAPKGDVIITGTLTQNQTLTANNTLTDIDGLGSISYQWLSNNKEISNTSRSTYKPTQSDVGNVISVKASYTDGFGTKETVTSAATAKIQNVNDAPTGNVSISGLAAQGQTLKTVSTLADLDGLGTIKYQWLSSGLAIAGATKFSYVLGASDAGKTISVKASYTDLLGTIESVTSQITDAVISTKPSKGNDVLTGTAKNDTLSALAGNDILTGGLGADKLTGGLGADIFKYMSIDDSGTTTKTRDTITDFKHSEGDKIDLSAIVLPSDQSFTYIGTIAFSNDATAQLRLDPKTGLLYGSTNADNIPEFSILLSGVKSLVPEDFIL